MSSSELSAVLAPALASTALEPVARIVCTNGPGSLIAALAAVPVELREKPVLNDYVFGDYLIFAHVRPFIDARADMYGGAMLGVYLKIADGDEAAVKETLARYRIAWTIFAPTARIVGVLDREHGWRRLYADDVAVVQVRVDALPTVSPPGL